jgi:asparagine synthase (glutamine-hydrolysing)
MCGIAGVIDFAGNSPSTDLIESMTRSLAHRGPDGQGVFRRDGVALGHRRLSIIDIAGGKQPLANETEQVWLTYNGELYNYRELRTLLAERGHRFRTESDSEVIVHAYEEWGDDCVKRFRGMFAFGIADFERRRVLLACDQLGIKPLYYRATGDQLAFASELGPLTTTESTRPRINCQALDYYLRYRYIPAPSTIYESIVRLPPGHLWSCSFDGRAGLPRRYWSLRQEPEAEGDATEWLNEFEGVLEDSVRRHLVSDVPFGVFLSGGVDSTLVAAQMVRQMDRPVEAFSIGFEEEGYCELTAARRAAELLGVKLHAEIVRPDVVGVFADLFAHFGQPFADTSAVPTWCVAKLAKQHVSMVLSGDGADEAFAGYGRYQGWLNDTLWEDSKRVLRNPKAVVRRWARTLAGTWPSRLDRWQQRFVGVFSPAARRQLWHAPFHSLIETPCSAFRNADREASGLESLEYAQSLDLQTYLPGDILTKVDVATMCHGLEARTPFTDIRVLEFAARVPRTLRFGDAGRGHAEGKVLPKRALRRRLPADFVHRPKQGFAIPESTWLRRGTPVRACFDDLVASPHAAIHDYFRADTIARMTRRFDERGEYATGLWLLLILGHWFDQQSVCDPAAQLGRMAA